MSGDDALRVTHDSAAHRYELTLDGTPVGHADYSLVNGIHVLDHTVVDPAYQGRGLASILVDRAIADIVARGGRFVPTCSYVVRWLERHHEYDADRADLPPAGSA